MKSQIYYEWSIEEADEHGDIIDNDFSDTLANFPSGSIGAPNTELVLTRKEGNENEGITDCCWAYVKDGKLPETFSDAYNNPIDINVPKRFHKELQKYNEPVS